MTTHRSQVAELLLRPGRRPARRGAILLIIMGMLAMFGLVAIAFVLNAGQFRRTSRVLSRVDQKSDPPKNCLDQAAAQIFRGPNSSQSVMGPHCLLEDIYGPDSVATTISNQRACQGAPQLMELSLSGSGKPENFVGCVLTITSGLAAGHSAHIVGLSSDNYVQVMAFDDGTRPKANDQCVINGAPFSGMGLGYNPDTGLLDRKDASGREIALLPNLPLAQYLPCDSANEDYDAADYQNMLLGAVIKNADGTTHVMPSLHRPELCNYWKTRENITDWNDLSKVGLVRSILLRPNGVDHPNFCKCVNPNFNPAINPTLDPTGASGCFDVDNDGDGVADSIWVDLGMPARAMADGRLYKPLFAILCVDLDGKLNVNAHGNLAQTNQNYTSTGVNPATELPVLNSTPTTYNPKPYAPFFAGTSARNVPVTLPRGQGWGPADINLLPLFAGNYNYYTQILTGISGTLEGRYGDLKVGGAPVAGVPAMNNQTALAANPLSANLWFEYQGDYYGEATANRSADAYGSPPDMLGMAAVGLDPAGRPLFASMVGREKDLAFDPYKLNLSRGAPRGLTFPPPSDATSLPPDNPFSAGELERFLRLFDRDATTLPNRLWNLTCDQSGGSPLSVLAPYRTLITTDSWDLPCPGLAMPKAMRDSLKNLRPSKRPSHLTDLLLAKGAPAAMWKTLLPPEMLAGMKMDINRPFGNGRDDNSNGVVDEDVETNQLTLYTKPGMSVSTAFNRLNTDNPADFGNCTGRELHARYLYVLAMLLCGDELKAKLGSEEGPRLLAQWAVNVVDFRDRDSIMTRFAYDINPFDGWNEPLPTDTKHVVWGCERPELVLTETLAFHDRRTEDLDTDDGKKKKTTDPEPDPNKKDLNFDQQMKPLGSLFVELYNPNSPMDPSSGEFQPVEGAKFMPGVMVNQTSGATGDPVWRLAICKTKGETQPRDPDDPDLDAASRPDIERSVYFATPKKAYGADGTQYYPSTDLVSKIAPVLPGRYMVVGPDDKSSGDPKHTTYLGKKGNDIRRIELNPSATPDSSSVTLAKSGSDPLSHVASVAVINTPQRLSVTEPTAGYKNTDSAGGAYNQTSGYPTPYDTPFELDPSKNPLDAFDKPALEKTGTTNGFRIVHLQRLADPTKVWDATTNPYLTVDSLPIDLTAFNGLFDDKGSPGEPGFSRDAKIEFTSRERGTAEATSGVQYNLWKQEEFLPKRLSLGTSVAPTGANNKFDAPWTLSLGYINEALEKTPNAGGLVAGDPSKPFPWLTWNNRPYSSQLELLLVPCLRSSKLLACPDTAVTMPPSSGFDIPTNASVNAYDSAPWSNASNRYYSHLLPFLESELLQGATSTSAQFFRLLDYIHVPSRFVGAQVQGNPQYLLNGTHSFHPPFNKIPTYREPGRINLNTIYNREVLEGLTNSFKFECADAGGFWNCFVQSRRGQDSSGIILAPNGSEPTVFARPFRTFAGSDLVPLQSLRPTREINATLLRADPDDPNRPLFSPQNSTNDVDDTTRSPFFHYQGITRLGNLVTTRSNVYAVWITMGYFEVTPWPGGVEPNHPDGLQLGGELGADSGETVRHRAFYMFDRSIPVGFMRGMDVNVENAVLLRRYIE